MKKLIVSLLALAVLFTLAVPAMAASPVKDYASAKEYALKLSEILFFIICVREGLLVLTTMGISSSAVISGTSELLLMNIVQR